MGTLSDFGGDTAPGGAHVLSGTKKNGCTPSEGLQRVTNAGLPLQNKRGILTQFAHYNPLHGDTSASTEAGLTMDSQATAPSTTPPASSQLGDQAATRVVGSKTIETISQVDESTFRAGVLCLIDT